MKRDYLRSGALPYRQASPQEVAFAQRCLSLQRYFGPDDTPLARQGMTVQQLPPWCALLQPDNTVNYGYFIQSGTVIGHAPPDAKACRHVHGIYRGGDVVLPAGLFERSKSLDALVTVQESTVMSLHYLEWTTLMEEHPGFNLAVHTQREARGAAREAERDYLARRGARERLHHLLLRWPDAFAILPNWVIAGYLGISIASVSHNKRAVLHELGRKNPID